ncbi:MAG: hypothetical protein M3495_16195 [Pseudomonadota bacterium]|nr:hypothetical protein [Pseudomonadota bacterium]
MPHHHYLIVGGGMTADAAIRGIREVDSLGSIGLIGAETERPYNRPPLRQRTVEGQDHRQHLARDREHRRGAASGARPDGSIRRSGR